MEKVNLVDKLGSFREHWSPKIVGELNGNRSSSSNFKGRSFGTTTITKTSFFWS